MGFDFAYMACSVLAFIPAIVLHEVAHGFAAYKLGDPTAKAAGRLSLNPLKHVDPFGTVLMPLMLLMLGWPVFGYAKPVPYNPRYFKNIRLGDFIVGMAGPAANLIQAIFGALVAFAFYSFMPLTALSSQMTAYLFLFLQYYCLINLYLMFFNLIPVPPLDGSSIIALLVPKRHLSVYYRIQQYALPIFMLLVLVVPYVFNINPIGAYLKVTAGSLFDLLFAWM